MIRQATTVDQEGNDAFLDVNNGPVAGSFIIPARYLYHPHPVPPGVPDLVIPFESIRLAIVNGYIGI
jgi:hypothetical protein